jgi:hypothetical protein
MTPHNFEIRRWAVLCEETLTNEHGLTDGEPLIKYVISATIKNPFAGRYLEDLQPVVVGSEALGVEFGRRIREATGGRAIESYGKGCVVGVAGEYEHGNAFLTSVFATPIRKALGGGDSWIPSTGKRGGPGTTIDLPLAHKDELYVRSHYDTITAHFADGPSPDEVIIAIALATRGRLRARLGGPASTPPRSAA